MSVDGCKLVVLPRFDDERGSLSFVEAGNHVPFEFKRIYYIYEMREGAGRGAHAHKALHQLMIPMAGSFDVVLDDSRRTRRVHLSSPNEALYIRPMIWRDLENFSAGAVCMVIASMEYDEDDYFRNYDDFVNAQVQA